MTMPDEQAFEAAALAYIQRYQCSVESLRRVLLRKLRRIARLAHADEPDVSSAAETIESGRAMIEALIDRYLAAGWLDDAAYAAARTQSLHRRGASKRMIAAKLGAKGIDRNIISAELAEADPELRPGGDLAAALALARRRRIGPFRTPPGGPASARKDLAALCRAGFDGTTARRVLDCPDRTAATKLLSEALEQHGEL